MLIFNAPEICGLAALMWTLAWVLLAASGSTALQADFLAANGANAITLGRNGLGCANVGFNSDFFRHGNSVEMCWKKIAR